MEHVSNSPALNSRGKAQNARVRPMQKRQGPLDFALLITVVIICAFGLVMVFSASYYYAQSRNMDNGFYYLKNQSMYFAIGFAIMGLGMGPIYPSIQHMAPTNFGQRYSASAIGMPCFSMFSRTVSKSAGSVMIT